MKFSKHHLFILAGLMILAEIFSPAVFASGIWNMNAMWRQRNIESSWLGGGGNFSGGFTTGVGANSGIGDGLLNTPGQIFVDSGGSLYVADQANHRIDKYNASTGAFIGWIGNVSVQPTGGATGCSVAASGTFTPGWCTGGSAKSGNGDGMMNTPTGIYVDGSGNLYVADSGNFRINKYNASTGAFIGWIGNINASPTGGDTGCAGAGTGTFTPGWCKGGTGKTGVSDGAMNTPTAVTVDAGGIMYVSDSANHRINKYTASTGALIGWIGNINTSPTGGDTGCNGAAVSSFTPGWCTGGTAKSGTGDGMLNTPAGLLVSGGTLYVADSNNHRISRYTASTGVFTGWIGNINTSPTGGDTGCNGAAVSSFTPGWCTGGTGKIGTGDGMMNKPISLFVDGSDHLFVGEGNHRIDKYTASTGAFIGWIGNINASPTGGDAGCNGAAVSTFTPGWCKGGSAKFGTGDGMLRTPNGLFVDSGGKLYVSENTNSRISKYVASTGAFVGAAGGISTAQAWTTSSTTQPISDTKDGTFNLIMSAFARGSYLYVVDNNHRISRFNVSTGAFAGWVGKIATSPTGGDAGCAGAAVGTVTPGWCTGGTSASGNGDGMLSAPYHVFVDTADHIYVAEYNNSRVSRFTASTGVFTGWIGRINASPTGGDTGCAGASSGTFTPGWCKGGTSVGNGTGDGSLNAPHSVEVDGNDYMYVSDHSNSRINKYVASTGAFVGWIGNIGTSPTGGAAGCNGAAVGTFTPGWCTGGSANTGTGDGMFSVVGAVSVGTDGYLYGADTGNSRINKFNAATGAFVGWIGRINASPTGGDAGCAGAATNSFTPGWCTGGTAKSGTGDGALSSPESCYVDSAGILYGLDYNNSRVNKYKASTGAFLGWMGLVKTSPTGGAAACSGAPINVAAPGWCTGGTTKAGTANGMLQQPTGVHSDGAGNVYIADFFNYRIMRYKSRTP